jgi:hypothetical protein
VLIVGAVVAWWVHRRDVQRRTTHLDYELDEQVARGHAAIETAFDYLKQSEMLWRVISHQSADWKHHGGASTLIARERVIVNKTKPPYITTNIPVPSLSIKSVGLFFFPDQLLVWQQGRYGAVSYGSLSVEIGSTRFVEDGLVPRDATVVGQTWQHPNKSGGPDRRFANNRQLSIARYGTLGLTSPTGLNLQFQVSSDNLAQEIAEPLRATPCQVSVAPRMLV